MSLLFFHGGDFSEISAFAWAGADIALFGEDVSGPVLRFTAGAGRYDYETSAASDGRIDAQVALGEAVLGWRHVRPGFTAAAFAGVQLEDHRFDHPDPDNPISGKKVGAKVAAEFWWQPTADTLLRGAASHGTAFDGYYARLAGGYALMQGIYLGPEAVVLGNARSDQQRLGLALTGARLFRTTVDASIGAVTDRSNEVGLYVTVSGHRRW